MNDLTISQILLRLPNYGIVGTKNLDILFSSSLAEINPKKNTYLCICEWDLSKETLGEQSIKTQEVIYTLLINKGIYETTN
jgi:hypothetical protein